MAPVGALADAAPAAVISAVAFMFDGLEKALVFLAPDDAGEDVEHQDNHYEH